MDRDESSAEARVVQPDKRREPGQGRQEDMVLEKHQVAELELWVDASGRIRNDQGLNAELVEDAHRNGALEARQQKELRTSARFIACS